MSVLFDILGSVGMWEAVLRIATPLILGTLGVLLCERVGVLNLGIEGIMAFGAMIGWLTVYQGGDLWTGMLAAALGGAAFGFLHALLTVPLGLSQHVTGLGITLFASSFAYYVFRLAVPTASSPPTISRSSRSRSRSCRRFLSSGRCCSTRPRPPIWRWPSSR